jgi:hypothetical protein
MNVEIRTKAAQFPEKEYINGIFVAVQLVRLRTLPTDLGLTFCEICCRHVWSYLGLWRRCDLLQRPEEVVWCCGSASSGQTPEVRGLLR